jgi:hypothetical protein
MRIEDGHSLARFISDSSDRFDAKVLEYGSGCWVFVRDATSVAASGEFTVLEPIAEILPYLRRARRREKEFPRPYLRLLARWQAARRIEDEAALAL